MNKQTGKLRFPKSRRILKNKDYLRVYASQQRGGTALFSYHVIGGTDEQAMQQRGKVGITVSKKVSKRAVHRNRLRRQIREAYRLNQGNLFGAQIVITAKPASLLADTLQRQESLLELFDKLRRWRHWHVKNNLDS